MPDRWKQMAEMTGPICASGKDECAVFKNNAHRCCDVKFCRMASNYAKTQGIELQPTDNPVLPFMGENGCIVPPHLRPICTLHVCSISWASKSHIEHDEAKTKAYFDLRKKLGV